MILSYRVDNDSSGKTVKQILKGKLAISERLVKKLKYDNKILCNQEAVHINAPVKIGDLIEVFVNFSEDSEGVIPENISLDIIYEDDCLIAINKQPGMVVHPTCSHLTGTVANGVMYHLNQSGLKRKIRPVSRLDRDTSGIIIFAKNQYIQQSLVNQMESKVFFKEYTGIVNGIVDNPDGTIDLPIERKPGSIMLRHTSPEGCCSVTHYQVVEYLNNATHLNFILETGRTHQIRVHCQALGHSLIGDTLYSDICTGIINRQALHSCKVRFEHPLTGEVMELKSPIPQDMVKVLEILRK